MSHKLNLPQQQQLIIVRSSIEYWITAPSLPHQKGDKTQKTYNTDKKELEKRRSESKWNIPH